MHYSLSQTVVNRMGNEMIEAVKRRAAGGEPNAEQTFRLGHILINRH